LRAVRNPVRTIMLGCREREHPSDRRRLLWPISSALLGSLAGLLMAGTREGVLPSYIPVGVAALSAFALCWRADVRDATLRILTFSAGALAAEAIANSTPALRVSDPVLVNAILLVGIGDALAGLLVLLPIALVAGALAALLSGGD